MITETDILDCFAATPIEGQRNYLVAVGRAIEAKVLDGLELQQTLLRQCELSGQVSAAQMVAHRSV